MKNIKSLLRQFKRGKVTAQKVLSELKAMPYKDLGFAKLDDHRALRRGFPEVVYGQGKNPGDLAEICSHILRTHGSLLVTRCSKEKYLFIKNKIPGLKFDERAGIIFKKGKKKRKKGLILIITAGTSDLVTAHEALVTAQVMGNRVELLSDVGVAGLHRLLSHTKLLMKANVIVTIAGMEGALASVVSGLVPCPVIAVPTSVGYGASFKGIAPLLSMLNSCSPGVAVVNIDNGFGAGYFASMINR